MKNDKNHKFSSRTAALLAQAASFDSGVLASAAKKMKEEQEKEQGEKALAVLKKLDGFVNDKVATLQRIRKQEKAALADVKKFDAAMQAFVKTGDTEKLIKDTGLPAYYFGL